MGWLCPPPGPLPRREGESELSLVDPTPNPLPSRGGGFRILGAGGGCCIGGWVPLSPTLPLRGRVGERGEGVWLVLPRRVGGRRWVGCAHPQPPPLQARGLSGSWDRG